MDERVALSMKSLSALIAVGRRAFVAAIISLALWSGASNVSAAELPLSEAQKTEIESLIRQYILDHPEIIVESVQGLQAREEQEDEQRARTNLVTFENQLLHDPLSPVGGNPDGDVTIVEFFDYRCGFCKKVFPAITELLETDPNVRLVFKEFPILGPESVTASRAALAAWRIDSRKYEALHDALMQTRGKLPQSKVMKIAANSGFDVAELKAAMALPEIDATLEENLRLAQALNINGTPAFVIGNELILGAIDLAAMRKLVAQARGG